ncbi:MAG: hypothetical protein BZ135_02025 [Methanosphaera sp. rholeuAM6]|nr:MAG: hypothetical protein BZ135_02025 [Methanosphaera sp. rholeuAM6]
MTDGEIIPENVKEKIMDSKLFDEEYYLSFLNEQINDPLEHYILIGYKKGLNPSKEFDTNCYLKNNKDVKSGQNPLVHYVLHDFNGKRKVKFDLSLADYRKFRAIAYSEGLFDDEYYIGQLEEKNIKDPLDHYYNIGSKKGLNPSPLFNTNNYLENNRDVAEKGINPLVHYCIYSLNSFRKVNYNLTLHQLKDFRKKVYQEYLFDDGYYLAYIEDKTISDPLDHYLTVGYKKGFNPSENFDTQCYLENNKEAIKSGLHPLIDYVLHGLKTNRKVKYDLKLEEYKRFKKEVYEKELFDDEYYCSQFSEEILYPLDHYMSIGYLEGKNPSALFDSDNYNKLNRDVEEAGMNPLLHFVLYGMDDNRKFNYNISYGDYENYKQRAYDACLFDDEYYQKQYSQNINDLFAHYLSIGWLENKNPSTLFNTNEYLFNNRDVEEAGMNPLLHFLMYGMDDNRKFNFNLTYKEYQQFKQDIYNKNLFDDDYYRSQTKENISDPFSHYMAIGYKQNLNPSYIFNTHEYMQNHSIWNENPLKHFMKHLENGKPKIIFNLTYQEYLDFKQKAYDTGLFDDDYYLNVNGDVKTNKPFEHYIVEGYKDGNNPSKYFDTECFLKNSQDIARSGLNPFVHYIRQSFSSERKVKFDLSLSDYRNFRKTVYDEGLFDEEYYLSQCNGKIVDPLDHYLCVGWKDNKNPSLLFNTKEYLEVNWDVAGKDLNPLLHFVIYSMDQTRHFNYGLSYETYKRFKQIAIGEGLFDEEYYLAQCDNKKINDAFNHYLAIGSKKGYDPSKYFSTTQYLKKYPDVEYEGMNPLVHYCLYGFEEDRVVKYDVTLEKQKEFRKVVVEEGLFDEEYYLAQCDDKNIRYSLDHYLEIGSKDGKNPSVYFDTDNYLENNPDVFYLNKKPLVHFVLYALDSNRKVNHNLSLSDYKKFREYVYDKGLFDEHYYLLQLNDDEKTVDLLEHYLNVGYKRKLNPSKDFNTQKYVDTHEYLNDDVNPLIDHVMKIIEEYYTIANSELFDEEFYLTHGDEIEFDESTDPIMHYILEGAQLGLNPSAFFCTSRYLEEYPDVKESGMNPFHHFIKYGQHQSKDSFMVLSNHLQKFDKRYKIHSCTNMLNALEKTVSIIIPIYNAYEQTKDCITSVLRNTGIDYELILIDDCSSDERINDLLTSLEVIPNVKVIRNKTNQGFVKNVNLGMSLSQNDVVLLNSDTVVTPHWLSHMVYCAYSVNRIGTVTPFSNSSDISISELESERDFYKINRNGYIIDQLAYNQNIEAPTGNGFCLFVKRELIEEIGLFDERFGMGYGEETDFTYRAFKEGWLNIRDDAVFVYHSRHASFSQDESNILKVRNRKILEEKYDDLYDSWDEFIHSESLEDALYRIELHFNDKKNPQRILYVTHMENNRPVLDEDYNRLSNEYETFILVLSSKLVKLGVVREGRFVLYEKWEINSKWDQNSFVRLYLNILLNLKIQVVYVKYFYNYYNPNDTNLSIFIKLLSRFEIPAIYEATTDFNSLTDKVKDLLYPMESLEELIEIKANEIDFNKYKMVVYTALTGNYDELVTPSVRNPKFDYICFTDNPNLKSNFWTIQLMEDLELDSVRKARHYKILPHKYLKDYDYSLWIDANFDIIGDVEEYIAKHSKNHKLLAMKHDLRDDIYDEAEACKKLEKDDQEIINKQIDRYKEDNYPQHNGLVASGILFRKHNDHKIKLIMNDWYSEVYNYSKRDQLSFNYVCWKHDFQYDESDEFYFKNQYFQRLYHNQDTLMKLHYNEESVETILEAFDNKISIIIPIYNAYEETKSCIESVKRYTTIPYELLLIDDCSTDKRIRELLSTLEKEENIRIIRNTENRGFVKSINLGFEQTGDDVVILNSDTEVTPKWLQKLKITAYTKDNIATVTPLSNNAGAFSVPEHDEDNEINPELGVNSTANIVEKISEKENIYVPTGNGFCMYIRREAIYSVGFFDEIFGRGYCEENDFCMRLMEKGWLHAIDTSTYILHKHNVSFSTEKEELYEKNRQLLEVKYPDYSLKLLDLLRSYDYKDVRDNIKLTLDSESNHKFDVKRILYLIHEGNGGTLHTSIELMANLPENIESYILVAGKTHIKLYKYAKAQQKTIGTDDDEFLQNLQLIGDWDIETEYTIKEMFNREFRKIYFNVLYILKIDLVHIRHLMRHSFDMPFVAKKLGIPVILSFHDYYYVCPSHNLIDDYDNYCGGHCTAISSKDAQCNVNDGLNAPILKTFIHTWQKNVSEMLEYCDAFVTTSKSAYNIYTEFYPQLRNKTFEIIEHGRDITTPNVFNRTIVNLSQDRIKILFPGHINVNKGGWLIKAIKEYDNENKLEFHFMGNYHKKFKLEEIGTYHGYYKRSEFCKQVNKIKPHFIGLFSIWPETYCHTLTESWGCGIPVITINNGALGERVSENGGGFFIENNPKKAYEQIIEMSTDLDRYLMFLDDISRMKFKSTKEMANEYIQLYEKFSK